MKIGVGFLLIAEFQGAFGIYTIREKRSKPEIFKEAGMISFPLETLEESEHPEEAVMRLYSEEMDVTQEEVEFCRICDREFHLIPGRPDIITLYGFGFFRGDPFRGFHPKDTDIEFAGWKTLDELMALKHKRIEVAPIVEHFSEHFFSKLIAA